MTRILPLVAALLLLGCASTPETARPSYPVETVAMTALACKGEAAILEVADADARSREDGMSTLRRLMQDSMCGTIMPPQPMPLTQMIHEYDDFQGARTQVRRIADSEYFTLFAVDRPRTQRSGYQPIHGDAEWIMNHPKHGWCCGPEDCHVIPAESVTTSPMGFVVEWRGHKRTVLYSEAKPSIDDRYWLCESNEESGHFIRCLFTPNMGA